MRRIGISLGMKCDAAVWGIENGIRERKINGYQTCPFDEMLSNYPGILECLRDDFKYFCDTKYLEIIHTTDGPFIFNSKYKFAFNHESPGHDNLHIIQKWPEGINHFINNNYAHFIQRYEKRINSFRSYLSDPNNYIEFILQRYNTFTSDLWQLNDILLIRYPHLKFKINIIFIDNITAKKVLQLLNFNYTDEEIYRLQYWFETPNYNFNYNYTCNNTFMNQDQYQYQYHYQIQDPNQDQYQNQYQNQDQVQDQNKEKDKECIDYLKKMSESINNLEKKIVSLQNVISELIN